MEELQRKAIALLQDLLKKSLIDIEDWDTEENENNIQTSTEDEKVFLRISLKAKVPAVAIGRQGETLFALQHMWRLLVRRYVDPELEVVLDIDNYRKNQEANAELVAKEAAKKVRAQSIAVELPPMPSYRRRAVHTMFMNPEYADLEVYSIGDGLRRRIKVQLKGEPRLEGENQE
ncbi:MAG: hypothetical protein A2V81_02830 [Candidatus Abawacabacteria bacterium RBG_16_42_10]|uniref:R3H domain-containing protein n=1 Tax=Candidatus Abawacabacteria bacterium RBG_16_42_10 TaxID=1817814 RepID=A0A1F4XLT6_9BACT|nr:MAG: hypothetical protein A2V81_02830 [Candidatus Abawacabacteria bacterium RBG_16_42_10]